MTDPHMKILEMVQSGKISPEQAARLLQALQTERVRIRINIPRSLLRHLTE